ncbi:hypothetical protein [Vibrio sp. HN007]|uniref:hypothetical protein n=1 Tax=Vibrio iocasae TaxID=3098914 RepID=UPI0035D4720F
MKLKTIALTGVLIAAIQPSFATEHATTDFSDTTLSSLQFGSYAVGTKIIFAKDEWFYKPHLIRDYYYLNWFNYYLKDDVSAKDNLTDNPFTGSTSVRSNLN